MVVPVSVHRTSSFGWVPGGEIRTTPILPDLSLPLTIICLTIVPGRVVGVAKSGDTAGAEVAADGGVVACRAEETGTG